MKRLLLYLLVAMSVQLAGCTQRTVEGDTITFSYTWQFLATGVTIGALFTGLGLVGLAARYANWMNAFLLRKLAWSLLFGPMLVLYSIIAYSVEKTVVTPTQIAISSYGGTQVIHFAEVVKAELVTERPRTSGREKKRYRFHLLGDRTIEVDSNIALDDAVKHLEEEHRKKLVQRNEEASAREAQQVQPPVSFGAKSGSSESQQQNPRRQIRESRKLARPSATSGNAPDLSAATPQQTPERTTQPAQMPSTIDRNMAPAPTSTAQTQTVPPAVARQEPERANGQRGREPDTRRPPTPQATHTATSVQVESDTQLRKGTPVQAKWGNRIFAAEVVETLPNGAVKVHFVGWNSLSDEAVARDRLWVEPKDIAVADAATIAPQKESRASAARIWRDKSGNFQVEAELIDVADGKAQLKRTDGKVVSVPVTKLSNVDQEFISETVKPQNDR